MIVIIQKNFFSGELGPSTIVGSVVFNLLVITAVCVVSIDPNDCREINDTGVFAVTATFSVFAYLWLIVILQSPSPDIVGEVLAPVSNLSDEYFDPCWEPTKAWARLIAGIIFLTLIALTIGDTQRNGDIMRTRAFFRFGCVRTCRIYALTDGYDATLSLIGYVSSSVFLVECVLKLYAFRLDSFWTAGIRPISFA